LPEARQEFVDALEALKMSSLAKVRESLRTHHLTGVQFLSLHLLAQEGPAPMSSLAHFLGVRPQTVTRLVDALEREGLVERISNPGDRRGSLLKLSPKALRTLGAIQRQQTAQLKRVLRNVPPRSLRSATRLLLDARSALEP
jgi:DNA-binding MarR family transcriptional regulator